MKKINMRKRLPLTAKLLRLLRTNRDFRELSSDEKTLPAVIPAGNQDSCRRQIEAAWLDMERRKAEAMMESQRRRVIY